MAPGLWCHPMAAGLRALGSSISQWVPHSHSGLPGLSAFHPSTLTSEPPTLEAFLNHWFFPHLKTLQASHHHFPCRNPGPQRPGFQGPLLPALPSHDKREGRAPRGQELLVTHLLPVDAGQVVHKQVLRPRRLPRVDAQGEQLPGSDLPLPSLGGSSSVPSKSDPQPLPEVTPERLH